MHNIFSEMRDQLRPLMHVHDIQCRTAQDLMREQLRFVSECFEAGVRHSSALRANPTALSVLRAPLDTSRDIGQTWINTRGRQWRIVVAGITELAGALSPGNEADARATVEQPGE